jgi:hypothetical protein
MNSQINLTNKKTNFTITNMIKNGKKNVSSRSNTQEMPHYNRPKNKSSSCKNKKSKNANNSLYNNKNIIEDFPKKFTGININISSKINSDSNPNIITTKSEYKNMNVNQYKEILNLKEKKIAELERQILLYKDKLKNQIRILSINTSLNSFNLSKTRSSTNVTERNMYQIRSLSNSNAKIKTSYPLTRNLYGGKKGEGKQNKNKSKNKKKPKSSNYRKPKINNFFFGNKNLEKKMHVNNFKRSDANSKQKYKNKNNDILMNYKRAKSSNVEKNNICNSNNNNYKNNVSSTNKYNNSKNEELLTVEQTQILCDNMMEKLKNVLELVKMATTGD